MSKDYDALDGAQDALNKMARAYRRGTGCHISADQIRSLSLTRIGEMWSQDDPRAEAEAQSTSAANSKAGTANTQEGGE